MNNRLQVQLNMVGACLTVAQSSDYKPAWNGQPPGDVEIGLALVAAEVEHLEGAEGLAADRLGRSKTPRIAEAPASLEGAEGGTLQIGSNRVVIGLVKRVHIRDELFDAEKLRVRVDKLFLIGRMAAPHWYCRTRDRFELIRPA